MSFSLRWFWGASVAIWLLFIVFLAVSPALATDFNLTTSPLPVDLTTSPGHSITTQLRVQNNSVSAEPISISLRKFKSNGTNGTPQLAKFAPSDPQKDWVSFSRNSFVAQPGQWNEVTMTINPPSSAAFGYYYAVLFSNAGASSTTGTLAQLKGAVATLVLLDVQAPGERRSLSVTNFSSTHGLYEYLPASFTVTVKNTGNVHVIPSGTVFIKKGSTQLAALDLNSSGGHVLPGTDRVFKVTWADGFPVFAPKLTNGQQQTDKHGRPIMSLNWNFSHLSKLRIGGYNAQLVLSYDNGHQDIPLEGNVGFWVIPWKVLPVAIIILGLIGIGLWTSFSNSWRRVGRRRSGKP